MQDTGSNEDEMELEQSIKLMQLRTSRDHRTDIWKPKTNTKQMYNNNLRPQPCTPEIRVPFKMQKLTYRMSALWEIGPHVPSGGALGACPEPLEPLPGGGIFVLAGLASL